MYDVFNKYAVNVTTYISHHFSNEDDFPFYLLKDKSLSQASEEITNKCFKIEKENNNLKYIFDAYIIPKNVLHNEINNLILQQTQILLCKLNALTKSTTCKITKAELRRTLKKNISKYIDNIIDKNLEDISY